jgi:hypothetical protein
MSEQKYSSRKNDSRRRSTMLSLLGSACVLICVFFFTAFVSFKPDQRSLSDRYFPSATPTFTSTPTFTPTVSFTPTITSTPTIFLTPTATTTPHLLITPSEDSAVVEDRFDTNNLVWLPYYQNNQVNIADGTMKFSSDDTGSVGIALCHGCPMFNSSFYFQAEVWPSVQTQIGHGLAFCASGLNEYYAFVINSDSQYYSLSENTSAGWKTLVYQTASAKINRYPATNILAVQYDEGYIRMYVNGNQISSYIDPEPKPCYRIGLFVDHGSVDILADNVFAYLLKLTPTATVTP